MRDGEIALVDVVVPLVVMREQQGVDHRRVGLQAHPLLQPVVEDTGDPGPLLRPSRLLLDDAGERHSLQLIQVHGVGALRFGKLPRFLEAEDHRLHDASASRRVGHGVRIRKEIALERRPRHAVLLRRERIAHDLEEIGRGAQAGGRHDRRDLVGTEPFRGREPIQLHLTADELADHLVRQQGAVELVLAGLGMRVPPEPAQVREEAIGVGNDARVREEPSERVRSCPRRDVHRARSLAESRRGEPALVDQAPADDGHGRDQSKGQEPEDRAFHRQTV